MQQKVKWQTVKEAIPPSDVELLILVEESVHLAVYKNGNFELANGMRYKSTEPGLKWTPVSPAK